jgi:hypothetical protein
LLVLCTLLQLTATWTSSASKTSLTRTQRTSKAVAQYGWVAVVDDASGQTYYFNHQTGESQWETPVPVRQSRRAKAWRLAGFYGVAGMRLSAFVKFGGDLPYTLRNGDEQVLSRWNMVEQTLTVSRKQAVVQCLADGTATLTSEGRGPTLWRERGGYWVALQKGDQLWLADGDQVSLDCNDPEGAVFTCQDARAFQQGHSLWEQNGAAYFYDPQRQTSDVASWDDPPR